MSGSEWTGVFISVFVGGAIAIWGNRWTEFLKQRRATRQRPENK
jgi:hypothetical protein